MSKYTRGLLAVMLAIVLVLPAAAFAMLPEANARSSTGMDGPTVNGTVVDPDTSGRWEIWAAGHGGNKVTTQNVGRIWTDKTVKETGENEKSDFLTTLSAMSSTSNSTVTVTTPLDIVMVLDASGSMDGEMGGRDSTKRIDALKSAANSFIDSIAKQNEGIEGVDRQHKVAIVKFAGKKSNDIGNGTYRDGEHTYNYTQVMKGLTDCSGGNVTILQSTIKKIQPAGATHADYGLQLAEGITSGRADAKKIVVFFTDGTPTSYSEFDSSVANAAVTAAKSMKDSKATVYTIGIFDGADPKASVQDSKTSQENKFMQAVSSNYPNATKWNTHGTRAENSDYYKSATNAEELKKVFDDISQAITSEAPYPTEIHKGYDETKSGYITFTDELGDFMQVDGFTEVVINGTPFTKASKTVNKETNTDTYEFTGKAKDLLITVQRAGDDNPQKGDIVTVNIPASLIPLSHFKTVDGKLSVDNVKPIQVKYASSVKSVALDNLFTPEEVTGLKAYIEKNTTVADDGTKTVNFYANKWETGALGNTVATFEPADTNRYYYFQKQTPIYTDKDCTQPAKNSLADTGTYYYKDEFEEQGENGKAKPASAVIEFIGGDAAKFDGAIVADEDGSLSFSVGTARLAFIDELHTTKESVGGNNTGTATDVLNPKWNNVSAKATATHVNSYLGNNGKISFNVTPTTVDTKASFGLTKVLEGRDWTDEDKFEFELSATSENDAPMPAHATATVTNDDLDDNGKAAIDFGEITCNKPGEYTYEVREVKGGAGGITYSENVATFKVTVAVKATGGLKADVEKISGKTEFKNTYSAKTETPLTLEATKTLTGRPMADDEFKFALSYAGHDEVLLDATNKGGKVEFGPLTYTTESLAKLVEEGKASVDASSDKPTWTIRYIAAEQTGKLPAGVSATVSAIDACVTVVDNGDGTLTATAVYGDAGNELVNTYAAAPVEASLVGKKNLQVPDGLTPADIAGKFTFTVTGEEGAPMPAPASVTNDAKGKVDFGKITFTLDDLNKALGEKPEKREHTFTYTVTESGEVAGVTNDAETSRTVSFTVTDDGEGTLRVSRKPDGDAAFTFTNTYSVTPVETSVTDQITATKVLTGRGLKAGEFRFELVEGEGEDAKVVATGTNNAEGKITMNAVKYDKPGKHTYTLREVNGGTISKGVTYSDAKYTVETTITDNGDGTLKAEHVLKDDEPVEFKNTYSVTPLDEELDFDLSKAIDGRDWTDADKFSFTITAPEGTPLPDPATVTVTKQDADNEGIAAIKFGKIHYTAAGTYKYEIRENAGSAAGMTYDAHVATAEVTVTENGDGTLTANVTKKESGRFTNTYRSELDYAAAGGLKLSKTLYGRPMTEGQFTFTVTPADEASAIALGLHEGANVYKSPATAEATVGLIDILAGHEVKFTQADAGKTFTYTVAEKNDGQPGYTYDEAVRTVTIAIADDGAGTLTATTTVSGGPNGT
ncbi:MAG: FctA domain-containing protein, partial [Collinsella sp.]|nr:FctA domain-containing protein [Collinsella sp.]